MNISMPEIFSFGNSSQDVNSYDVDSSTKTEVLLIGPLIKLLQTYIYSFLQHSEAPVLNGLRAHELGSKNFTTNFFKKTLLHMSTGYIFIGAGVIAFLLLPLIFCKKLCTKKSINLYKYQPCFCVEGFLFIITCVVLFFATVCSIQTAVHVDDALQSQPALARDIVHDLLSFSDNLHVQLTTMKEDYDNVLDFVLKSITDVPDNITGIARKSTDPVLSVSEIHFNKMYSRFEKAVHNPDIITDDGSMVFLQTLDVIENDLRCVRMTLDQLKIKVIRDKKLTQEERKTLALNIIVAQNKASMYIDRSNMTDWKVTYDTINHTLKSVMPQANESLHFLDKLKIAVKDAFDRVIVNDLRKNIKRMKSWTNACLRDFNVVAENIAPQSSMNALTNLTLSLDRVFNSLNINRAASVSFSGRIALMLIPGVHSICVILIVMVGGIIGMCEVKQQNKIGSKTTIISPSSVGAKIFRFGTLLSYSLLWLNLLIAGIVFMASSVVTMACLPVMDFTIFVKYLDDPQVWAGRTWIDSQMEHFTDNYTTGIKMTDVLESCSHHHTLYTALNSNKMWELEEKLNVDQLSLDDKWLISSIYATVENLSLPNLHVGHAIITSLEQIQSGLDFNFTLQIQAEVARFQSLKINEKHLMEMLKGLSSDPKYDYIQDSVQDIMYNITRIETRALARILRPFDQLDMFRRAITAAKVQALEISDGLFIVKYMMTTSILPKIAAFVTLKAAVTNNFATSFTQQAITKIQSQMGNCFVLFNLFVKARWSVCEQGLTLLNAVWISHGVIAVTTLLLIGLGCRITSYFRGAQESAERWSLRLLQKEKDTQEALLASRSELVLNGMGDRYGHTRIVRSKRCSGRQSLPLPGEVFIQELTQ